MLYVNKKKHLIKGVSSISDFQKIPLNRIVKLRNMVVNDSTLIDSFIKENPFEFTDNELKTVESWKEGVFDTFFIVKYEKDTAIFYHPETEKCYGVLLLNDQFEDMLGSHPPRIVQTWLIPFNDRIIYDGLLAPYNIVVGRGMRKSLGAEYQESIVKHGVLTSFSTKEEKQSSDEEMLKFYMKSEINRDKFWEEIETLKMKNAQLEALFHREQGRYLARKIKKNLKEIKAKGHFAVVDNVVVAIAPSKKELNARITEIIPKEKKEWIHQFRI